jgi:hypothetical protein
LAQPVGAEGLDGARQENHGDTRDEENHCPHGKPQDRNWADCVIAMIGFALAREAGDQAPASASTVARRR